MTKSISKKLLSKYIKGIKRKPKQEDDMVDNIVVGNGLNQKNDPRFKIKTNINASPQYSLDMARNQSASSITNGGNLPILNQHFSNLSFGKKPKPKFS